MLNRFFAVALLLCGLAAPAAAQTKPNEKLISAQVDLKMAIEQMPENIAIIKNLAAKNKHADYNELRAAIDRLRRSIRLARGETRCFKTEGTLAWRAAALELDLQMLGKEYYKVGMCDIPFLLDDMDAVPVAIANTLKPITDLKLRGRPARAEEDNSVAASTTPLADMTADEIKGKLAEFRAAGAKYAAENKGKSFTKISALVPSYLPAVPPLKLPEQNASAAVMVIEIDNFPPDIGAALSGAGGWAIIGDAKSTRFGQVYINSDQKSPDGKPWYQY